MSHLVDKHLFTLYTMYKLLSRGTLKVISLRVENECICMNWFTLLKKKEGTALLKQRSDEAAMTQTMCQKMLCMTGLTMITRFHQVHALREERERGHSVVYELYICQEDQLSTLTCTQFEECVRVACDFRNHVQRAVQRI